MAVLAYVHSNPKAPAGLLGMHFRNIAALWRAGILDDGSTVWFDAQSTEPLIWALTDKSQPIYLHHAPVPGYVHLVSGRLRWSPNHRGARSGGAIEIATQPLSPTTSPTMFVVHHRNPGHEVKVINGPRLSQAPSSGGVTVEKHAVVVDLPAFHKPASPEGGRRSPSELEASCAMAHGAEHVSKTLTADEDRFFRENISLYAFEIPAEELDRINAREDATDAYGRSFGEEILRRHNANLAARAGALNGESL